MLPSPFPFVGSLLLTDIILQTGSGSQVSTAAALTDISFIDLIGNGSPERAETEEMTGGVVSTMDTDAVAISSLP
jgi:hypothetical protein